MRLMTKQYFAFANLAIRELVFSWPSLLKGLDRVALRLELIFFNPYYYRNS